MHIFISHSSSDAKIAQEICAQIEQNKSTCFIAPRDIRSGREYAGEIINGINNADAMVLIMSENANKSPHVLREVERAVSRSIPILVYKLEDVNLTKSMEYFLMAHQWIIAEKKKDYGKILDFIKEKELKNEDFENTVNNSNSDTTILQTNTKYTVNASNKTTKYKNKSCKWIIPCMIFALVLLSIGISYYFTRPQMPEFKVGDTVTLGSYNNQAIEWRILKISDDGKQAILISSNILTMKAYDVAEGGTYNSDGTNNYWSDNSAADTDLELQMQVRGNNDWSQSNIRTWLNSSDEIVTYDDQAPTPAAMSEEYNGYHSEAGFLNDFTEDELNTLVSTEIITTGNALSSEAKITTCDKVFLLSKEELRWFEDAGMSLWASPTEAAIEQDKSNWYDIDVNELQTNYYYWWLREPVTGTSSQCYMVNNGYTLETLTYDNVGTEGFGIRPAITVDLTANIFCE